MNTINDVALNQIEIKALTQKGPNQQLRMTEVQYLSMSKNSVGAKKANIHDIIKREIHHKQGGNNLMIPNSGKLLLSN